MNTENPLHPAWTEYDHAAEDLAIFGLKGAIGDPLPYNMTPEAVQLIADDPEAFQRRVREHAYALAMSRIPTETPDARSEYAQSRALARKDSAQQFAANHPAIVGGKYESPWQTTDANA